MALGEFPGDADVAAETIAVAFDFDVPDGAAQIEKLLKDKLGPMNIEAGANVLLQVVLDRAGG